MADGVQLNAGVGGDTAMADDLGADGKAQGVKLVLGANNTNDGYVASGNPLPVTFASQGYGAAATFTPAAASHTAGDCNGAAQNFASMGPSAGRIVIVSATLEIDSASAEATAWRLHLYNVTPTSAIADDAVWNYADSDRSQYLGFIDLPSTAVDIGSNQWVEVNGFNKMVKLSGTGLYGYLVNLTTVTPANVAHIVTLHAIAA